MTAAEIRNTTDFPTKIAWMACHFSPYGLGLSNLPRELPPGSLLMVDDITPPHGHDPGYIAAQLEECVRQQNCCGVLLDFQRTGCEESKAIAEYLAAALPCPTVVSETYARDLQCPVFLPPVPPSVPLENHLSPWKHREIWLELGLDGEILTLTEKGCEIAPLPHPDLDERGFADQTLHCHYQIETKETSARFTLWRTNKDLIALLKETENRGTIHCVGLYQEIATSLCSSQ